MGMMTLTSLKVSDYGYPILAAYCLPTPLSRTELFEKFNIDMIKGRQYVKQTLVDTFPTTTLDRAVPN